MNAIIFDLDGVLCHTDEHHYMAWKAIADELHIPFNREVNNQLRGVSRMESLKLILRNSPVRYSEQEKFLLAEKKNNIYRELLQNITSKDLADGAWAVLEKLHAVHIPMAIGSSSKNTPLKLFPASNWWETVQLREHRCAAVRKLDVTVLLHGHRVMPARTEVSHNALQRCATLGLVPNARVGQRGSLGGDARLFG